MNEVCMSWSCEIVVGKSSGSIAILGPKESSAFAICVGLDRVLTIVGRYAILQGCRQGLFY